MDEDPRSKIQDPNTDEAVRKAVEQILAEIQPALALHRGGAELASVQNGRVEIKLKGACEGCEMSSFTFGMMVDAEIKKRIPEIKEVIYA